MSEAKPGACDCGSCETLRAIAAKDRESGAWVSFASAGLSADSMDPDTDERFPMSCPHAAGSADVMLEEWKKRRDEHGW